MLSGTIKSLPRWCQPAPSQMTTAIELGAICVLISFRCSFIPSVFAAGMIKAAPTPLFGADGTEDVGGIMPVIAHHQRSRAHRTLALPFHPAPPNGTFGKSRPHVGVSSLLTHPGLVLEPDFDRCRRSGSDQYFPYQAGEVLFKRRFGLGILLRMHRPRLQAGQPELVQPFTDGAFMHLDAEAALYLSEQIGTTPTHHVVYRWVGSVDDQFVQLGHLWLGQKWLTARRHARLQTIDALIVVAMHPITQCLPIHPVGRSGDTAGVAIQHHRQGEKAANLCAFAALPGKRT
jgi:hypothetical protein